jgi:hypothetical protein
MSHKFLALLPPLLLGLLAAPVPGRPASGRAVGPPAGHPAAPPDSGRFATVRGTVRLARSGRPLAGVLLIVQSCSFGYFGAIGFAFTGDSTRTDAQGRYELRFRLQEEGGIGYVVKFDPEMGRRGNGPSRYVFHGSSGLVSSQDQPDRRFINPDKVDTVNFRPDFAPNSSRPIELHLPKVGH